LDCCVVFYTVNIENYNKIMVLYLLFILNCCARKKPLHSCSLTLYHSKCEDRGTWVKCCILMLILCKFVIIIEKVVIAFSLLSSMLMSWFVSVDMRTVQWGCIHTAQHLWKRVTTTWTSTKSCWYYRQYSKCYKIEWQPLGYQPRVVDIILNTVSVIKFNDNHLYITKSCWCYRQYGKCCI